MLISAEKIKKSYSEKMLLNEVSLYVTEGDKIGVIGVNGTGKSTLLKILAGVEEAETGTIITGQDVHIQYLDQNPVWDENLSVLEHLFIGNAGMRNNKEFEAKRILTKLGINNFDQKITTLSGGQRKRVALAGALINPGEVIILDEPTNHLDSEAVLWLENYLIKYNGAIVMVTHDRYFLDRVTNIIVEIDKGNLFSYQANYSKYIEMKLQREEMELGTERKRQSLLKKELVWMQRDALARGTKSKERIAKFHELKAKTGPAETDKLEINLMSARLGKKIIEINNISKGFDGELLISNFEHVFVRNSRIGIVGKNGCGKSTLLNIISGALEPDSGSVIQGETVKLGYFSQETEELDLNARVIDYIKGISGTIETSDGALSATQMLEKFLFTSDIYWNTIGRLSGGERRRLYLLSILMQAPNLLILDEPTNDLDIQTLTILEEYVEDFDGPVIVVSHDRYFLDKVTDTIFEFQNGGVIKKFLGGYSDYLNENTSEISTKKVKEPKPTTIQRDNNTGKNCSSRFPG